MQITINKMNGEVVNVEAPYYCTDGCHFTKILDSENCLYITLGSEIIHPSVCKNFSSLIFESDTMPTQITETEFETKLQETLAQILK